MDAIKEFILAYLPALISVVGAIITIIRFKPEVKKINSEAHKNDGEASSAIGEAAESIANAAKVSNEQLMYRLGDLDKQFNDYKKEAKKEIEELKLTVRFERQKRIDIEKRLILESQARVRAESKITALQGYIEQLKTLMRNANVPVPPPFVE